MSDRRRAVRHDTIYHSKAFDAESGELVGYTVDLSATGIRLMALRPFEPGRIIELKCMLPREIYGQDSIQVTAAVQWCKRDVNPDYEAVGLELVSVSTECARIIHSLMLSSCFNH